MSDKEIKIKHKKKVVGTWAGIITAIGGATAAILGVMLPHMNKSTDNIIHHIHHMPAPKPEVQEQPVITNHMPTLSEDFLVIAINAMSNEQLKAQALLILKHMNAKELNWTLGVKAINDLILKDTNGNV